VKRRPFLRWCEIVAHDDLDLRNGFAKSPDVALHQRWQGLHQHAPADLSRVSL